jgi:hypothetical protein
MFMARIKLVNKNKMMDYYLFKYIEGMGAVSIEGIEALLLAASGVSVSSIAHASDVLRGVPRSGVRTVSLGSKVFLGSAGATVIAVQGRWHAGKPHPRSQ